MRNGHRNKITELFANRELIDEALARAVREALLRHKQAGNPVCEWRDGKIVWIPPEEILIDEPEQPRDVKK